MWRQFLVLGGGLLLVGGLLFVAGMGSQDLTHPQAGVSLLGVVLAGVGGMLFQAGLVGAAVGADWRSLQKGQESLEPNPRPRAFVCDQCGEASNRVGSLYCGTCGAQLSS